MYSGKLVFAQVMEHLPLHTLSQNRRALRWGAQVKSFSCLDQFLSMAFAQLTFRESWRRAGVLRAQRSKLYHLGLRSTVARNTLPTPRARLAHLRRLRAEPDHDRTATLCRRAVRGGVQHTVYALDTTIDLSLSVFPWASYQATKGALRLHTLLDLRGNIPTFIHISDGKMNERIDQLIPEPGAFYIMDRGFP